MFLNLLVIKQIANLVNSRLIMIIKEVDDTKEDTQVIKYMRTHIL